MTTSNQILYYYHNNAVLICDNCENSIHYLIILNTLVIVLYTDIVIMIMFLNCVIERMIRIMNHYIVYLLNLKLQSIFTMLRVYCSMHGIHNVHATSTKPAVFMFDVFYHALRLAGKIWRHTHVL